MKVEIWPNKLGANVRQGRLMLEVWYHGGIRRCVSDNSLCGFTGTHYTRVAQGTLEEMAAAGVASWNQSQSTWSECQP